VLLDHREQVAEQGALLLAELFGERIGAGRAVASARLADAGVPAPLILAALRLAQLACALLCRNRSPSWCLATQAA